MPEILWRQAFRISPITQIVSGTNAQRCFRWARQGAQNHRFSEYKVHVTHKLAIAVVAIHTTRYLVEDGRWHNGTYTASSSGGRERQEMNWPSSSSSSFLVYHWQGVAPGSRSNIVFYSLICLRSRQSLVLGTTLIVVAFLATPVSPPV